MLIVAPILGVIAGSLGIAWRGTIERRAQSRCSANLGEIGLALHEFHDRYGHFPPAYIADAKGRPIHSWRVLLLEFLDPALFKAYHFDEPWDGPNNRRLASRMPRVYACPNSGLQRTGYAVIVGPETIFPGIGVSMISDITDGTSRTIMVAEVAVLKIPWMEPRDLAMDQMSFAINSPPQPCISGSHPDGAGVLFADGRTTHWHATVTPALLRSSITKSEEDLGGSSSY